MEKIEFYGAYVVLNLLKEWSKVIDRLKKKVDRELENTERVAEICSWHIIGNLR